MANPFSENWSPLSETNRKNLLTGICNARYLWLDHKEGWVPPKSRALVTFLFSDDDSQQEAAQCGWDELEPGSLRPLLETGSEETVVKVG